MGDPIRAVIVDDDALVRAGLAMILNAAPDIEVVGEAGDGHGVQALVDRLNPDVVLMDIRAREKLAALSEREREIAVLVARGASNAEIAADLVVAEATVKAHVSHILTKLDLDNRVQIAICVHEAGEA